MVGYGYRCYDGIPCRILLRRVGAYPGRHAACRLRLGAALCATDINDGGQIVGSVPTTGRSAASCSPPTGAPGTFCDVAPHAPYTEAVAALAARGIVLGTADGCFRPGETTLRAQLAALVARSIPGDRPPGHTLAPPDCAVAGSWDCEDWGNDFKDRGGLVAGLWRNVGTLQHYGVAQGWTRRPSARTTWSRTPRRSPDHPRAGRGGDLEDQPGAPFYPGTPPPPTPTTFAPSLSTPGGARRCARRRHHLGHGPVGTPGPRAVGSPGALGGGSPGPSG
ncbi:MAG: S-layer homology domain-containing protein [Chloroflexia bacterium]